MKFLAWIGGIVLVVVVSLYVLAFTPIGNSLLQPTIESKIREQTKLESKLTTFSLSISDFSIVLEVDKDNTVYADGTYSLFSQAFSILYKLEMNKLQSLKTLTNAPLKGAFHTNGSVEGDMAFIDIDGVSDVASSDTTYHVELSDFTPTSIVAKVKKLKLEELLEMLSQKSYASADVNLDVNFKNITPHALDGTILLNTVDGKINTKVMKNDFNITIPKTAFTMNLDAKLKGNDIDYLYSLNSNLAKISSSGSVTPEPLKTDIKYGVDIKELALLKPITNAPLRGAFQTDGSVVGSKKSMLIDGKSNIASSKTNYKVNLVNFKPMSVLASIKGAKLEKLLYMVGEPRYASSKLDVYLKLTSLDPKNLAGNADIKLSNGLVNSKIMKATYKVNIPKTTFNSTTHVDLKAKDIDYKMLFNSNLVNLSSSGNFVPEKTAMDLVYGVDIKELAVLKPITDADLRGAFRLNGKVKGDKESLVVDGRSDFASSDTTFKATLKDFAPASIKADIKNLKLSKAFYMLKQPKYADGIFSLNADIQDARTSKLKGSVASKVEKGVFNSKYLSKAYKFKTKMPHTKFNMRTNTILNGDMADTKVDFDSSLVNFDAKSAKFNISDSSIKSDYRVSIANLDKLFFVTERHIKGGIKLNGDLKKAKDLDLSMHSKVMGGKIDAKLHNDDFHADIIKIQTLDAMKMLIYPEILKASLNAKLDYNLATAKGDLNGDLVEAKFTKNQMLDLVKKFGNKDLYEETFKGDVTAKINKEHILANVALISRTSSIITKNAKLNSKSKAVDSKIDILANKHPITIHLKGTTDNPKLKLDVENLAKEEAKKAIMDDLNKKDSKIKKLFKKLF